jgi:hypothetical protein
MKFLAPLVLLVAFALTAPAAGPTYYLVDGVVTAEGIPPQSLPTAATVPIAAPPACYVDANGNTVCPTCPQAKPTACFAGGCPCLPGSTRRPTAGPPPARRTAARAGARARSRNRWPGPGRRPTSAAGSS